MRFKLTILAAIISFPAFADSTVTVFGQGNKSCAKFLSADESAVIDYNVWIVGYWSGANSLNVVDHTVGNDTDAQGVVGEVRLYCSQHPSATLFRATGDVYFHMSST